MQLKANKTSMYKLAKRYIPDLPNSKEMRFTKAPRSRGYFLESYGHKIYLSVVLGRPFMMNKNDIICHPTIVELQELGMIEE